MDDEPIAVTLLVISALEQLGIAYLISGSLAGAIYGEPRSTRDADILADVRSEHAEPLSLALGDLFNIPKESIEQALLHRTSFNAIHYETLFKIDVFVPKRDFDRLELQRRKLQIITSNPERSVYLATAEDLILAKLDWYRQGNEVSEQQWRDVVGILKAKHDSLDLAYMRQTAAKLGVTDLLERLIGC